MVSVLLAWNPAHQIHVLASHRQSTAHCRTREDRDSDVAPTAPFSARREHLAAMWSRSSQAQHLRIRGSCRCRLVSRSGAWSAAAATDGRLVSGGAAEDSPLRPSNVSVRSRVGTKSGRSKMHRGSEMSRGTGTAYTVVCQLYHFVLAHQQVDLDEHYSRHVSVKIYILWRGVTCAWRIGRGSEYHSFGRRRYDRS